MRALFYSLILVSFAASASTSPFTGTWILKSREVKATSGDCAQSMTIKANRDSLKISNYTSNEKPYKRKLSDYGLDGRVKGGCSSGTSLFTFESWSGCSWEMDRADSFDDGNRIQTINYKCSDKTCTKREVNQRDQYQIQAVGTLLFTDRWYQGTELQKMNCGYARQ